MRVDTRPRKRNAPRVAEKAAPGFLQYLRGRPCIFAGPQCSGRIEAAHLDFAGGKGMGTKVADKFAIPMCACHHAMQHFKGWITFCRLMGTTKDELLAAAARYWWAWPGHVAWEKKLEQAK